MLWSERRLLVAGVVILYHPDEGVLENIKSYLMAVDVLYVLENSEVVDERIQAQLKVEPKIEYIFFGENKGIAAALNHVLALLPEDSILLTMDQDSRFAPGDSLCYLTEAQKIMQEKPEVAMCAANYRNFGEKRFSGKGWENMEAAITSGCVVRTSQARKIQGFDEKLFIDEVDIDFCLRLVKAGCSILRCNDVVMEHHIGSSERKAFLWKRPVVHHHGALRKYYIARNRIYMIKKHPELLVAYLKLELKSVLLVLFYECDKIDKLSAIFHGIYDGCTGRMGRHGGT